MSYPKRHPVVEKESQRDNKQVARREQMKNLLITKFRGKFAISGDIDSIDRVIRDEVETFLLTE
jgi:hypothetical protein